MFFKILQFTIELNEELNNYNVLKLNGQRLKLSNTEVILRNRMYGRLVA